MEVHRWHGYRAMKNPYDAWMYQEIIHRRKPELIIETGTAYGGGALFLSEATDAPVYTIDKEIYHQERRPQTGRIHYLMGDSADPILINTIPKGSAMVILDCQRHPEHLTKTLELYAPLIGQEQYLIVEDTWAHEGIFNVIAEFLRIHTEFMIDKNCDRYICSGNKGKTIMSKLEAFKHDAEGILSV